MLPLKHRVWLAAAVLVLPLLARAADPAPVRQAQQLTPIPADASQKPKSIRVKRLLSRGDVPIGELSKGWFCSDAAPLRYTPALAQLINPAFVRSFRLGIEKAGYAQPSTELKSAFDAESSAARPPVFDFELGISLKDIQANLCDKGGGELLGGVWMSVRWEVFSPLAQAVVLDVSTQGSYQSAGVEKATQTQMFDRAFAAALDNLLAQQAYFDLLHGKTTVAAAPQAAPLKLRGAPAAAKPVSQDYENLAAATVTLGDQTTGSGFYVSEDGYLLTNQHVVGEQRYIKTRLRDGRELIGEVVRVSRARDMALVKTPPPGLPGLNLRMARGAQTGEDVYLIGSPLGKNYSGSLTRGILSGHRTLDGLPYLQSDAKLLPGNSGGPLLDAQGQVIGVARMIVGASAPGGGINLFVPIADALRALTLEVE